MMHMFSPCFAVLDVIWWPHMAWQEIQSPHG